MSQGITLPGGTDRRRFERFNLKVFGTVNSCTIALGPGTFLDCSLLDVSCGGLRVVINSEKKGIPAPCADQAIEFRSFLSPGNRFLEGRKGLVAWYHPERREFGVRFDEPLPEEQVAALVGE